MSKHIKLRKKDLLAQMTTAELIEELKSREEVSHLDCDKNGITTKVTIYPKHANKYIIIKNLHGDAVPNHYEILKAQADIDIPHYIDGIDKIYVPLPTEGCTCQDCRIQANY